MTLILEGAQTRERFCVITDYSIPDMWEKSHFAQFNTNNYHIRKTYESHKACVIATFSCLSYPIPNVGAIIKTHPIYQDS